MTGPLDEERRSFLLALQYFTRLPVPDPGGFSQEALDRSLRWFPAVGIVVGGIQALVYLLAPHLWPPPVAAILAMALGPILTGAMHEDGLADLCDGFFGGKDRDSIFAIMRDPRLGSFGVLGLGFSLLLRYAALAALAPDLAAGGLVAAQALSRLLALGVMKSLPYGSPDPGKAKPAPNALGTDGALWALAAGIGPALLLGGHGTAATLLALTAALGLRALCQRKIGGYTGDCLGAVQQAAEIAFYLGLLL